MNYKIKKFIAFFIIITILIIINTGCNGTNSNYKNQHGYTEYISDSNSGYEDTPYYNIDEAMYFNEDAVEYYKSNSRRSDKYLITDYEDGVCINRYYGKPDISGKITIPEKIDGKSVIKIGCYLKDENEEYIRDKFASAFYGLGGFELELPATVKYISELSIFYPGSGIFETDEPLVLSFTVNDNNPYYSSDNGFLYTKDMKKLLYFSEKYYSLDQNLFIVPENVISFEPSNAIDVMDDYSITIGKNVTNIDMRFDNGENGTDSILNFTINGYNNTAAEQFAKKHSINFIELID